jgi:8-oxo-dGTP pyrophosphatase MutT (NUDIX family)
MDRPLTLDDVRRALAQPLPGGAAQLRMAASPRSSPAEFGHRGPPRIAAVLMLLYPHRGRLFLPLTRRTERVLDHKGQISLPGGAREEADPTLWDTALREAHEEIGVAPDTVEYIGRLSDLYIPRSHFRVSVFAGYTASRPCFVIQEEEVAEVIEMPLDALVDPAIKREEDWAWRGRIMTVPHYWYNGHIIWGATAMMLSEFEQALIKVPGTSEGAGHLGSQGE